MEWIRETVMEIVLTGLGIFLTALMTKIGSVVEKYWKAKSSDESILAIARTCVGAVEMMYREWGGEEKLEQAMTFAEDLLREKGIDLPKERIRLFLESALAEWKGVFSDT